MNILVVTDFEKNSVKGRAKLSRLIDLLVDRKNRIGILDRQKKNMQRSGVQFHEDVKSIREKDWDIVLVQHGGNFAMVKKVVKRKPIVFISFGDGKADQCVNLPNLYQILSVSAEAESSRSGIPAEWIEKIQVPVLEDSYQRTDCARKQSDHYKLVHFVDDSDEELSVCRELIRAGNFISYASLTIVTTIENIALLKDVANSNIIFSSRTDAIQGHLKRADLVLGDREMAVLAALSRVPVIVAGNTGLGGLICSDNLFDFIRTGFMGRIGGAIKEKIPLNLLDYEIRCALGIEEDVTITPITDDQYRELEQYYRSNWKEKLLTILESTILLNKFITNKLLSLQLKPRVSQDIFLQEMKSGELSLINVITGKLIGALGAEEALMIKACSGTLSIGDIISTSQYSAEDVRGFFLQLWENKVIILHRPTA